MDAAPDLETSRDDEAFAKARDLGRKHQREGDLVQAATWFLRAHRLSPDDATTRTLAVRTLMRMAREQLALGHYGMAIKHLETCLHLQPDDAGVRNVLARARKQNADAGEPSAPPEIEDR